MWSDSPAGEMSALAVIQCRPNSHPFQERNISLHEPVKVGRSVARARPAPNNAIFDCKVLSRNHALMWYENGKFYLQDTKSSNGTFVNNQRLSKGAEESPPHEIYSGDTVQFGVDVMENSRRVTHGCIIASIQLFYPDGREATSSHSSSYPGSIPGPGANIKSQELYQLAQYLQEALHREQMLENKLAALQRLIENTQSCSESGWQALIDEDRLLSRIEVLENQLQAYAKNQTEETLRHELVALQEDKYNYETTSKETLRKVLQEKLDAVRKLSELERSLTNTEEECQHLKEMCESSQKELQELAEKHQEQIQEVERLQQELQEAEKAQEDEKSKAETEKSELQEKLDEMIKQEEVLSAKVESLQADNDFTHEQLTNMKARMEAIKEKSLECGENIEIPEYESQGIQVELVNLLDLQMLQASSKSGDGDDEAEDSDDQSKVTVNLSSSSESDTLSTSVEEKLHKTQELIEQYKSRLQESDNRLKESKEQVEKLQNQLEQAQSEVVAHAAKISTLEVQLNESRKQSDNSNELVRQLKEEISNMEEELNHYKEEADRRNIPNSINEEDANDLTNSNNIANHINHTSSNHLVQEVDRLKGMLLEAKEAQRKSENQVVKFKEELDEAQKQAKKSTEDTKQLQTQLNDAAKNSKEKADYITELQEQLNKAEGTTKEVKQQIISLRDRLVEEQEQAKCKNEETDKLRSECLWRVPLGLQLVWHG